MSRPVINLIGRKFGNHTIPQSNFIFKSLDDSQFVECWKLENLRPMEKKANMAKGTGMA